MNELRKKIEQELRNVGEGYFQSTSYEGKVYAKDNNELVDDRTDAILDAMIAALPEKIDDGLMFEDGEYGRGYDNCIDEIETIFQSAKESK